MSQVDQQTVSVSNAASTPLVRENNKRTRLIISAPPTNRFTISFGQDAVLDQGITVYPATLPLVIDEQGYGCCIKKQINAISAVGTQNVTYVEVMDEKK